MTLVSIKNKMTKAQEERYAIPLFDVFEMQGIEGVMDALVVKRAPTIIGIYSPYTAMPIARALAAYVRCRADDTDVPISLMLDHGASVEQCLEAISSGFSDVMYDGSKLSIEENIANTRRVVATAHAMGVGVEAELGHVGMGDQYHTLGGQRIGFTDPDSVAYFVQQTGVDFLAIAFGNAHGLYKGVPQLDLELLAEIRRRVDVPLVMHGGTGLSEEQFHAAIAGGISKINYATNIMNTAADNMRQASARPEAGMLDISEGIRTAYSTWCSHLYDVFGATGKA